ncbi:hypothetical protein MMPV_003972 [Pyropia vietnamensis]
MFEMDDTEMLTPSAGSSPRALPPPAPGTCCAYDAAGDRVVLATPSPPSDGVHDDDDDDAGTLSVLATADLTAGTWTRVAATTHTPRPTAVAFFPPEASTPTVAVADSGGRVTLYDPVDLSVRAVLPVCAGPLAAVVARRRALFTGGADGILRVHTPNEDGDPGSWGGWSLGAALDVSDGGRAVPITALAVDEAAAVVAAAAADGAVRLYARSRGTDYVRVGVCVSSEEADTEDAPGVPLTAVDVRVGGVAGGWGAVDGSGGGGGRRRRGGVVLAVAGDASGSVRLWRAELGGIPGGWGGGSADMDALAPEVVWDEAAGSAGAAGGGGIASEAG